MLYLYYVENNFYPILISGKDITGKADIKNIVQQTYQEQYCNTSQEYVNLDETKRILIIDNIDDRKANNENYSNFLQSIKANFKYAIIFVDELQNLADKSTKHNYFYPFKDYCIKSFGHKKRDELIKKCIANNESSEFDMKNSEQVAKLDRCTKYINTIVSSNIIPSYPSIIILSFNIMESAMPQDKKETSYGHCYHAMITTKLYRTNIKPDSMDEYFNLLTEIAYFMFNKEIKTIPEQDLKQFLENYKKIYILNDDTIVNKLVNAHIFVKKNNSHSFQYIYIYYFFVAKYMADNFKLQAVKQQFENLISKIYKKDNFNIITFIAHHANNNVLKSLLDDIMLNANKTFKNFPEATLNKQEIKFLDNAIQNIKIKAPFRDHNVEQHRDKQLKRKDKIQSVIDKQENKNEDEDNLDLLSIEILKSTKSMNLIGQILKNQYGTFKKDKLKELFQEGQNVGLRLLNSFFYLMNKYPDKLKDDIEKILNEEYNNQLSKQDIQKEAKKIASGLSYSVVFWWLHKIVDSLGYNKLITISDSVNTKTNTTASQLINFSIHAWHGKVLDTNKLKSLLQGFDKDKNDIARHILKQIVSRHLYMHEVNYKIKQQISNLFDFSVQKQILCKPKKIHSIVAKA